MAQPVLPGLERLLEVCRRLKLRVTTTPAPEAMQPVDSLSGGLPVDPLLLDVYRRFTQVAFATDIAGLVLVRSGGGEHSLEAQNAFWRENWQASFPLPFLLFAGEPLLAHHLATVPPLADARGYQPVVWISTYDEGYALPVASTVDRLFHTYSRYLEALVADEDFQESRPTTLTFPWGVPHLLASDERLVQLLREGRFDPLLVEDEMRDWAAKVVAAAPKPPTA